MLEPCSDILTLGAYWVASWWVLYTWRLRTSGYLPEMTSWLIATSSYQSSTQRSLPNSKPDSTNSRTGSMSGIEKLIEFITQAKKREAQDEAMDRAQAKIQTALTELSESNENLSRAMQSTRIIVSQRNDP